MDKTATDRSPTPSEFLRQKNLAGEALLKAVNSLVQIARMHQDNNDLLVDAVRGFVRLINRLDPGKSKVSIQISMDRFYFQEEKLYLRNANTRLLNHMLRFFENRELYGIHLDKSLEKAGHSEVVLFARLLDRCIRHDEPAQWLEMQLDEHRLGWIRIDRSMPDMFSDSLAGLDLISQPEELALKKRQVRKSYAHTLSSVKDVVNKLTSNQGVGLRNSVRLVQKMVDLITEDESLFLGISTLRIFDDYTYIHSLNVAILSMCLGKRIGLTHKLLERLGLCGLFHDLGKAEIPKEILNKKGSLNPAEFDAVKNHSMHSARLILKIKAERDRKVRLLVPPFEHHIGYDHSGYPQIDRRRKLSLFGRILTITDVFDALTSARVYRPRPMSPDRALGQMLSQSGSHFDPILLKVFINMMGSYPVGTVLQFDSREMGIVVPSLNKADPARPMVQLLVSQPDGGYAKGQVVDLAAKDSRTGKYQRNVTMSLHPSALGIQPAEYLVT